MVAFHAKASWLPESVLHLYHRMANALRSPVPADAVAIARLSRVVELHHCVAAAITAAIQRSAPGERKHLQEMCSQQTRMADAVGNLVTELGGSPPRSGESSVEPPRSSRAMSYARNQDELMGFVREDLDHLAAVHRELTSTAEVPLAIRQRLEVVRRGGGVS